MTIAGSILQIILLLLPVILTALAARNTPQAIQKKTNEELDKAVVAGNTDAINTFLHDRLQDKGSSNPSGQSSEI